MTNMRRYVAFLIGGPALFAVGFLMIYLAFIRGDTLTFLWAIVGGPCFAVGMIMMVAIALHAYDEHGHSRRMELCPTYRVEQDALEAELSATKAGCKCGECRP